MEAVQEGMIAVTENQKDVGILNKVFGDTMDQEKMDKIGEKLIKSIEKRQKATKWGKPLAKVILFFIPEIPSELVEPASYLLDISYDLKKEAVTAFIPSSKEYVKKEGPSLSEKAKNFIEDPKQLKAIINVAKTSKGGKTK